ncbi:MAG: hypothetical protein F6K32_08135 [Desertifilum sp. SIO1I2]|nr:hypothetical protein [Desertifilum sp. SIO1I2]
MVPKFRDTTSWQQAEVLMQPALLRVVDNIRKQLDVSGWKGTYEEVETPIPGHQLCLQRNGQQFVYNIWDLCFQVCFRDYQPAPGEEGSQEVEVDTRLLNEEGEVDWQQLEDKTKSIIEALFATLPEGEFEND